MVLLKTCWIWLCISSIACTNKQSFAQDIRNQKFLEFDSSHNELPEIDLSQDEANSRQKREIFCEESLEDPKYAKIRDIQPTKATVEWQTVKKAEWYEVSIEPTSICVEGEGKVKKNEATFSELNGETDYIITIRAYGKSGDACSSQVELKIKTAAGDWHCDDSVEMGPVGNLRISDETLTTTSVFIEWDEADNAQTYDLQLVPVNYGSFGLGENITLYRELYGLKTGTKHTVTVRPKLKNRYGPETSLNFVTKLSPPEDFRISNKSSTYIQAAWTQDDLVATKYKVVIVELDQLGNETFVEEKEIGGFEIYFQDLRAAKKYRLKLRGMNDIAVSVVVKKDFYTELPKPQNITISNITSTSIVSSWIAVEGATKYKAVFKKNFDGSIKEIKISDKPLVAFGNLTDATEYNLEVYAKNDVTSSSPGIQKVYSRLKKVRLLNVDPAFIQDTSLVVRWDKDPKTNWYEIEIDPPTPGAKGIGDIMKCYTQITGLEPGTLYSISVKSLNYREFDTASTPVTIEQATQLPQPANLTASYEDIKHTSMRLTWNSVHMATTYYLYLYDCSRRGSLVDQNFTRTTMIAPTVAAKYKAKQKHWNYNYKKAKKIMLKCETVFPNAQEAVREAKSKLPSTVVGQGQITDTQATVTNLYPGTQYEIMLVAGDEYRQSRPTTILQYSKLPDPKNFMIDKNIIESSSFYISWDPVENITHYQLEVKKTVAVNPKRQFKLNAKRTIIFVKTETLDAGATSYNVRGLSPSTNYSLELTAMNRKTFSFPVVVNSFTRLDNPTNLNFVPDELKPNQMLIQWATVEHTQYYNISYAASNARTIEKVWIYKNITDSEIFLRDLQPNTLYEIRIQAKNRFAASQAAKADKYTKLPTPGNFTVSGLSDSVINLTWSAVEGCKKYEFGIDKFPKKPESFREYSEEVGYTFDMLSPNQAYRILMKATNLNTESDVIEIVRYTKLPQPNRVMFTEIYDKKLRLRWRIVEESNIYSIDIIAMVNESKPSTEPPFKREEIVTEIDMADGVPIASKKRQKRDLLEESQFSRMKRSESKESSDEVNAIMYWTRQTKPKRVFINSEGSYTINVTDNDLHLLDLEPGIKYAAVVRAVNQFTDSLPVLVQSFTKLAKPQSLEEKSIDNHTMTVRWRSVKKANYYRVEIKSEKKRRMVESAVLEAEAISTSTDISFKGLVSNMNYTISVKAGNDHVESDPSLMWKITKLSPIETIRVASVTSTSFTLHWDQVEHAEFYVVAVSPPMTNGRKVITVPADKLKVELTKLRPTTQYKVTLSAGNHRVDGVVQNIVQYTKLRTPEDVQIVESSISASGFILEWKKVPVADEYHITIGNKSDPTDEKLIKVKKPTVEFNDLLSGYKYFVSLRAHSLTHDTYSKYVFVDTYTNLETPKNFGAPRKEMTDTSFVVRWDPVPLAEKYILKAVNERRNADMSSYVNQYNKTFHVKDTHLNIENLRPASYYSIEMKAINLNTESYTVSFSKFTKLSEPENVTLVEHFYMDTEAELEWEAVKRAENYIVKVFTMKEEDNSTEAEFEFSDPFSESNETETNFTEVYRNKVSRIPHHIVTGLKPETLYIAEVSAKNVDTFSDETSMEFRTKSSCSDDYHAFLFTHLSHALPRSIIPNITLSKCLEACCAERSFSCRSVSMQRDSSNCQLFAEDRNIAPPLTLSKYHDHYERKFWKEVSGFQIRSLSHNNIAEMNKTVEITLTFVYVGKTGCIEWDFGEGTKAYHSILETDCDHLCKNALPGTNCTIVNTNPLQSDNKINTSHIYDMNSVYEVTANVSDQGTYEIATLNVAINERGCIYPDIVIEEDAKNINSPKKIFRSSKLVLSTTPTIKCNSFPGVKFEWRAEAFSVTTNTITNSFKLQSKMSEILIPPLTFELGMYRISSKIKLLDEEHDLVDKDSIYVRVVPSPLVAVIKGGIMRTIGYNRTVTWDSSTKSYDPDTLGLGRTALTHRWFCRNYTDEEFEEFESGSCFPDLRLLTFDGPGRFSLNTTLMHLYVEYEFQVVVAKGERISTFTQQVVVKEGDPPEFYIKCVENCKTKMNPTQALALNAICDNCKARRKPEYVWSLYEVVLESDMTVKSTGEPVTEPATTAYIGLNEESVRASSVEEKEVERLLEVLDWEGNTTTGTYKDILVLNKKSLASGKKYILRMNVSMDGLDDRVYSYSDFTFLTNLPPTGGVCSTESSIGTCAEWKKEEKFQIVDVEPRRTIGNITYEKCEEACCLMREFMCLSFTYNNRHGTCNLYQEGKDSLEDKMSFSPIYDFVQRIFYIGGAVVDEVFLECRDWKDEGDLPTYPKPGEPVPKTTLTYKYTALPYGNMTAPLLLYFGTVVKTPGISMALGDADEDYAVSIKAQICDMYGECALSNTITVKIAPPDSNDFGSTLTGITNGNDSKLAILSTTGNSKAAAQLVQSIASIINMNEEEEERSLGRNYTLNETDMTTASYYTTDSPTTFSYTEAYYMNETRNGSRIDKSVKENLRKDVVQALHSASDGMTTMDNLKQMTSAMKAITDKPEEISKNSQREASDTVKKMAASLSQFAGESNKEDTADAAKNIIGSLGSVAKSSETDMSSLKEQMMQPSDINFDTLDEVDQSPDEFEYFNKIKLKEEKRRVRRSALDSQDVMSTAMNAIDATGGSLLGKQLSGEPAVELNSERLQMKVERKSPEEFGSEPISTGQGTKLKLPGADKLFGKNATNSTEPVDIQVMAFDDNPLGFGDDAAFINAPVTMLKIGLEGQNKSLGNETEEQEEDSTDKPGVGISIPSKFNHDDMITIERGINDTGLSISKFEMVSLQNAILILIDPEDLRAKFHVYLRFNSKPTEEEFDFKFDLPHDIWEVSADEDRYKIFIPENKINKIGMIYLGINDKLNITEAASKRRGRRRRSVGITNSTTYHLLISTPGCRRFDPDKKSWTGDGCKVSEYSTPEVTECICTKLTATSIFSAEFFVPPNTINFATVFAKINIADNPAVFSTVICLLCLYIILLIWANRADRNDMKKWSLKSVIDNRKEDKYLYQVTVFTGHGREAATNSNVYCIIFGETEKTKARQLKTKEQENPLTRSSVVHFLVRVDKCLKNLTHIHIWHDNSGKGAYRGWYLDQIAVQDVITGERFYFICDQWLAVDKDDGMVDRILPVASPENMSTFHRLFISTTSQKFTEDHLWISVFYRPTKSTFTRVQRLSCCIALLFMTMIANAMWFESGSKAGGGGTSTLTVGPFTVSPHQLWTSFCSTLMVVPIVTLIVTLFKKAKTKEQEKYDKEVEKRKNDALRKIKKRKHAKASTLPSPSELVGKDAIYTINADGTIQAKEKTRKSVIPPENRWPHWCAYVAWTLVVLAVLASGFFSILYSFEWGRVKANRWLSNMMLSFWQSVLIVQPIKVIFFAMFVAAIVRKPDEQVMNSVHDKDVEEAEKKFMNLCADNIESEMQEKELIPPKPPSRKRLRRARRLRAKERAMSDIIWEVFVYFLYIMVLLFLCHGNRDSKGFLITTTLKKTFVQPLYGLKSVSSVGYFWRFVNKTLLPNLYPETWYSGARKNWRERSFLVDEQSYRVGPARLRQVRVEGSACPQTSTGQIECRGKYSIIHNDEEDYIPRWIPIKSLNETERPEDDTDDPIAMAWKFRGWKELKGMPTIGELTLYPGGGYSAELGVNYMSGKFIVDSLYRDAWIDHRTRAVFVEFTLYNPSVNLFTTVNLISEFPPVGAAVQFTNIVTFRLYHYVGSYGTLIVFAQAIFVLHLLYATYKTIKGIIQLRKKYFYDPWNVFELVVLFMDWAIAGCTGLRLVLTNQTIAEFHKNKRKYVNFQQVTTVDMMVGYFLALSAFFGILRFMKLLRFNKRIGMLSSVLKYSARQWPGFFVLGAVFFIAFIHVGYVVFSPFLEDFKNLLSTAETMIDTMMGRHIYPDLRFTYRFFGPIFYFIFCFTATFIIINVLVAIIGESYNSSHSDISKSSNQYEIMDFMIKRFSKWSGITWFNSDEKGEKSDKKEFPKKTINAVEPSPVHESDPGKDPKEPQFQLFGQERNQLFDLQKQMDQYVFDLETKYKKLLSFDGLRDEVVLEMQNALEQQRSNMETNRPRRARQRTQPENYQSRNLPRGMLPSVVRTRYDSSTLFTAKKQ